MIKKQTTTVKRTLKTKLPGALRCCRSVISPSFKIHSGEVTAVPPSDTVRKLDTDFFQGRWTRATDRQRELLQVISLLPNADNEFTVQEVVGSSTHVLAKLIYIKPCKSDVDSLNQRGLVYKIDKANILWPFHCYHNLSNDKQQRNSNGRSLSL